MAGEGGDPWGTADPAGAGSLEAPLIRLRRYRLATTSRTSAEVTVTYSLSFVPGCICALTALAASSFSYTVTDIPVPPSARASSRRRTLESPSDVRKHLLEFLASLVEVSDGDRLDNAYL